MSSQCLNVRFRLKCKARACARFCSAMKHRRTPYALTSVRGRTMRLRASGCRPVQILFLVSASRLVRKELCVISHCQMRIFS
jgi:hypothetical protein